MSYNINQMEEKMKKGLEHVRKEFSTVRTGRASISILDNIRVEYYGSQTPINQIANISIPQSRLIEIKPWDASVLSNIEKAILKSDLGLTPISDGKSIRINVPPLTEERRLELVKFVKKIAEDGRIALRGIRRNANEEVEGMKKKGEISEDEMKRSKEQIQKLLDSNISQIDKTIAEKEKEIMEV
ncbi:MAG: ribosome recycling factor [Candidatus Firestonebacteria bacterium]